MPKSDKSLDAIIDTTTTKRITTTMRITSQKKISFNETPETQLFRASARGKGRGR